jgi:hypothetical protein
MFSRGSKLMDETRFIRRKILLKKQAVTLIAEEIRDLQDHLVLLRIKGRLESLMPDGDPLLSQKIDCLNFLLEN